MSDSIRVVRVKGMLTQVEILAAQVDGPARELLSQTADELRTDIIHIKEMERTLASVAFSWNPTGAGDEIEFGLPDKEN